MTRTAKVEPVIGYKFRVSLMQVAAGGSLRVTIPKQVAEALELQPKQEVLVSLTEDNKIVIERR